MARVYDCLLDGSSHWATDREFCQQALRQFPEFRGIARANREFGNRVVRYLARNGIRQFLDIGSGVLSQDNTHQVADEVANGCRVVYVDNEPIAVAHAEVLLDEEGDPDRHAIIRQGLHRPGELWEEALATGIIDPREPIALLMFSILHYYPPSQDGHDAGANSVACYRDLLPNGSYLGISHVAYEGIPGELLPKLAELRRLCTEWGANTVYGRMEPEIRALFGDFEIIEPGIVWTPQWDPEQACPEQDLFPTPNHALVRGAVGRKPAAG